MTAADGAALNETWRPIPGHPQYEASDQGHIRSMRRSQPRVLATRVDRDGYPVLSLGRGHHGVRVHKLVAAAFLGPANGRQVRHYDGDPSNSRLENLRYGTPADNARDSIRHGTHYQSNKTHCASGHPYSAENTYVDPDGHRECRACHRMAAARYAERRRAERGVA